MPSNHLILCHPLLLPPSIFPSIRVFSNESALRIRWPKYWSFSLSPFNEYSGLISFRMDWWDLLAVALLLTHSGSLTAFLLTPRGCLTSFWEPLPPALGAPAVTLVPALCSGLQARHRFPTQVTQTPSRRILVLAPPADREVSRGPARP